MLFSYTSIFLGLALSAHAAAQMSKPVIAQTKCTKDGGVEAPQGYCKAYNEHGIAIGGQACRKDESGGAYANCH
ncbi:hypothetical protein DDE82_009066 [Stemphylium lycopersici]|uniref:Uncharacterized protein n=1 Tax=Stemphylium lycopersici TaxID=183478 RepID=A0A364NEZ5_STELY|nr:hypothetical protein DDE82_009066 [Stemphylium lycopersici]RAR15894.1 hypothetical protein DDE83_000691 [Stemphylium lycopersici]